jgi:hypothetical protein
MKYIQAKAKALNLTAIRQIDHIIYGTVDNYNVDMAHNWTGEIFETVKYTPDAQTDDKPIKRASKVRPDITPSEDKPEEV